MKFPIAVIMPVGVRRCNVAQDSAAVSVQRTPPPHPRTGVGAPPCAPAALLTDGPCAARWAGGAAAHGSGRGACRCGGAASGDAAPLCGSRAACSHTPAPSGSLSLRPAPARGVPHRRRRRRHRHRCLRSPPARRAGDDARRSGGGGGAAARACRGLCRRCCTRSKGDDARGEWGGGVGRRHGWSGRLSYLPVPVWSVVGPRRDARSATGR